MENKKEVYTVLKKQSFSKENFAIVPIRYQDRFKIMQWRNEQMYHLRQAAPLTIEQQENYFINVVSKLFQQENPNQILFSYLKNNECIGYGGLVHINWIDKHAEISFLMNTELEKKEFHFHWKTFLELIENLAFTELQLHKIYTYAFDIRQHLYKAIEDSGFKKEATLKEHCLFDGAFIDVILHTKINNQRILRSATKNDLMLFFDWANDEVTRSMSFNKTSISLDTHTNWFHNQLQSNNSFLLVLEENNIAVGQVKFNKEGVIGISIDKQHRGKKLGVILINEGIRFIEKNGDFNKIRAYIKKENINSIRTFEKAGFIFEKENSTNKENCFEYIYNIGKEL